MRNRNITSGFRGSSLSLKVQVRLTTLAVEVRLRTFDEFKWSKLLLNLVINIEPLRWS